MGVCRYVATYLRSISAKNAAASLAKPSDDSDSLSPILILNTDFAGSYLMVLSAAKVALRSGMKPACQGCRISSAQQERVMTPAALRRTVIATVAFGGAALVARPARPERRRAGFNPCLGERSLSGMSAAAF